MATVRSTLGEAIREAREARGLTQRELGQILDLDPKNIQRYENNRSTPELWVLERLFRFFDWPLPYSGTTPARARSKHIQRYVTHRIDLLRWEVWPPFRWSVRGTGAARGIVRARHLAAFGPMSPR